MAQEPSIVGSWLRLIPEALDRYYGIDGNAFLADHGVAPHLASDPDFRVRFQQLKRLWATAVEITGDEGFGLKAGTCVQPTTFHALGLLLWSSTSLKEMFDYLARYLPMFTTAARVEFREHSDCYNFVGRYEEDDFGHPFVTEVGVDATLAAIMTVCRSRYGDTFQLLRLELARSAPRCAGIHQAFFECPVDFNCPHTALYLDKSHLEAPLNHGNSFLVQELEILVNNYLARNKQHDLLHRVRATLLNLLPQGRAEKAEVAESLAMSPRTLHRKLRERGSSFQEQLNAVRWQLASQYMSRRSLSILEIGFMLGYSNASSFGRAFREWTGQSPQEYRAALERDSANQGR